VDRQQRHAEAQGVRRHVRRVRDERERVGEGTADDLHDHDTERDRQRDAQPAAVRRGRRTAGRRAVRVPVIVPSPHEKSASLCPPDRARAPQ
jgi:hypothetical protein